MPGMDGLALIHELKKRSFIGPILVLSNYSDFDSVRTALTDGAYDYFLKINMNGESIGEHLEKMADLLRVQQQRQTEEDHRSFAIEAQKKEAGVLRQKSTVAKGQGYEAQYTLVPSLTFSEQDAGRSIAGVIAMIPVLRDIAGLIGLAEQVKLKEAQTALLLTDNETTEQVAAATGSARTTDLGAAGALFGRLGGGAGAGWSNTNEGKVIAAAFLDSHNKLVAQVRMLQAKELPPPVATQGRP
jgi:CheY-like chemotaxis protein